MSELPDTLSLRNVEVMMAVMSGQRHNRHGVLKPSCGTRAMRVLSKARPRPLPAFSRDYRIVLLTGLCRLNISFEALKDRMRSDVV